MDSDVLLYLQGMHLSYAYVLYRGLCGSAGKESTCNVGDLGLIPGLGRSPGEGKGYPLQYSGLENPMDCIICGVTKSGTQLRDFTFRQYSEAWHAAVHGVSKSRTRLGDGTLDNTAGNYMT